MTSSVTSTKHRCSTIGQGLSDLAFLPLNGLLFMTTSGITVFVQHFHADAWNFQWGSFDIKGKIHMKRVTTKK